MKINSKLIVRVLSYAVSTTIKHDGVEFAGYLAYLWILSLFPFLFIYTVVLWYFTMLTSDEEAYQNIVHRLIMVFAHSIPENIINGIMPFIQEVLLSPTHSFITVVVLSAIWTSSSIVEGMRTIFNRAYRAKMFPRYILGRMMSVLHFLFITLVTLMLFVLLRFVQVFDPDSILSKLSEVDDFLRYMYTVATLFAIVCWLYMMVPNVKQSLKKVAPGAAVVVFLWIIAAYLFSFYIELFMQADLIYGSLTGIIIALIFFYIISLCLIFGAELNYSISLHLYRKK